MEELPSLWSRNPLTVWIISDDSQVLAKCFCFDKRRKKGSEASWRLSCDLCKGKPTQCRSICIFTLCCLNNNPPPLPPPHPYKHLPWTVQCQYTKRNIQSWSCAKNQQVQRVDNLVTIRLVLKESCNKTQCCDCATTIGADVSLRDKSFNGILTRILLMGERVSRD